MKSRTIFLIFILLVLACSSVHGQLEKKDLNGSWMGKLKEAGVELRLVLNFTLTDADTLRFTLDSPDQGAEGIPGGIVRIKSDTLWAYVPMVKGYYTGTPLNDTVIKGKWSQSGRDYPMEVVKQHKKLVRLRPQEPKAPFPYKSEDITFRNTTGNFDLAGTLTLPEGNGPFPAVVLITGSGQQDRDETIMYHKPFLVISDYLTRNGIAVLRYDDRGVGKSKGSMNEATSLTLADDAEAAFNYLLARPEIDKKHIGLAGHSEGGLIAPIVASRNKNVAFIVSLAGTGVLGKDLLLKQNRDLLKVSGIQDSLIEEKVKYLSKVIDIVLAETDQKKAVKEALNWYNQELEAKNLTDDERKARMTEFTQALVSVNNPWFRYFLGTDPAVFWKNVKCPVLALNGEKDLQVNYEQNLNAIKTALRKGGNKKVKVQSLPSLNHLFQHCSTGSVTEYSSIEETFSPEALGIMTEWIRKTTMK